MPKGARKTPKGRPKDGKSWAGVLDSIGAEELKDGMTKKEAVARKLWSEAAKGEAWAVNALMDRIDGKPKQQVETDINANIDAVTEIRRTIIDPKAKGDCQES